MSNLTPAGHLREAVFAHDGNAYQCYEIKGRIYKHQYFTITPVYPEALKIYQLACPQNNSLVEHIAAYSSIHHTATDITPEDIPVIEKGLAALKIKVSQEISQRLGISQQTASETPNETPTHHQSDKAQQLEMGW